jgi:hypothetical protein
MSWAIGRQPITIEKLTIGNPKMLPQNGGMKVNENWIKQYKNELMQLFGGLDVLSFVRTSWLNWTGQLIE